jgi:hypothetical protein
LGTLITVIRPAQWHDYVPCETALCFAREYTTTGGFAPDMPPVAYSYTGTSPDDIVSGTYDVLAAKFLSKSGRSLLEIDPVGLRPGRATPFFAKVYYDLDRPEPESIWEYWICPCAGELTVRPGQLWASLDRTRLVRVEHIRSGAFIACRMVQQDRPVQFGFNEFVRRFRPVKRRPI